MAAHKDLTGTDLHEPKGAASAASGTVYVADGLGSGAWTALDTNKYYTIGTTFVDVSTASTQYATAPLAGTIVGIYAVLQGALATADANLTFAINGTAIDSSAIVLTQSGSAGGSEFDSTPSGHNTVTAGDVIDITSDGASSNTVNAYVIFLVQQ